MPLCKCNSSGKGTRGFDRCFDEPHCASLATLMRSRPSAPCPWRALVHWLFFPAHCVTGSLLSSAFIPYKALSEATCRQHEISGLRHSHSLPQKRPGEQQAALREEAFNWPEALWVNTMFSGPVVQTKNRFITCFEMPCFNLCPQAKREGCMWCWRFNREQRLFRWSIWRRWESRRQLSPLEERPAGLSLMSDAIFMCCNSQRWAYTVLGGPAWICWSDTILSRNLYDRVCVWANRPERVSIYGAVCLSSPAQALQ